jgi:TonB family protein
MSMRSKLQCLAAVLCLMSISSSAACQLVLGRVRNKQSGAPLRQIGVGLVADTTALSEPLVRTTTDSSGAFYLDAPKPGTYRVAFMLPTRTMLSDALTIGGADVQREFVVDLREEEPTYFEFQVERPVRPLPDQPTPRYPESMRTSGIQGQVLAQFIVDTLGHADMSTLKILRSTHPEFTNAVRATLPQITFVPAELHQRKVRQQVQLPFNFCLSSGTPREVGPDTGKYWWLPKVSPRSCPG